MKSTDVVKIFLLGVVTALLAVLVFSPSRSITLAGDAGGAVSQMGDLMAVAVSGEDATLFLIDPVNKQLAAYNYGGDELNLNGARHYSQDLLLEYASSNRGMTVEEARETAAKMDGESQRRR